MLKRLWLRSLLALTIWIVLVTLAWSMGLLQG
ncbi:hypothetical protein BH24ACT26_BH24ACT26_21450 [soil metagenome]